MTAFWNTKPEDAKPATQEDLDATFAALEKAWKDPNYGRCPHIVSKSYLDRMQAQGPTGYCPWCGNLVRTGA